MLRCARSPAIEQSTLSLPVPVSGTAAACQLCFKFTGRTLLCSAAGLSTVPGSSSCGARSNSGGSGFNFKFQDQIQVHSDAVQIQIWSVDLSHASCSEPVTSVTPCQWLKLGVCMHVQSRSPESTLGPSPDSGRNRPAPYLVIVQPCHKRIASAGPPDAPANWNLRFQGHSN
jgi:hypothetical protein